MMRTHLSNFKPCFHLRTSWRFNKMMIVYFTCSDSVQFYDAMLGFQLAMQESDLQPCARHLPLGALTFFGWGWRWSKMVLTSCDGPARINSWEDIHATFWKNPLAVQVKPQTTISLLCLVFIAFGPHTKWGYISKHGGQHVWSLGAFAIKSRTVLHHWKLCPNQDMSISYCDIQYITTYSFLIGL